MLTQNRLIFEEGLALGPRKKTRVSVGFKKCGFGMTTTPPQPPPVFRKGTRTRPQCGDVFLPQAMHFRGSRRVHSQIKIHLGYLGLSFSGKWWVSNHSNLFPFFPISKRVSSKTDGVVFFCQAVVLLVVPALATKLGSQALCSDSPMSLLSFAGSTGGFLFCIFIFAYGG